MGSGIAFACARGRNLGCCAREGSEKTQNIVEERIMLSRAAALSRRGVRLGHTMSKDKYTQSPESFEKVLSTFKKYRACAVLRTPKAEQVKSEMYVWAC